MGIRGPKSKFSDIACPNTSCRDFGIVDMENIVGNGTYETQNERVRKFVCRTCGKSFNSRSGTVFHDIRTKKDTFILGLKMVLNDIPLRKISYVLDIKLDTIREWLLRAANHSEKVNEIFLKDLKISKVELDELWTFVKKKPIPGVASPEEERWIWVGFAKESRLLLCIVVGPRIQESADKLIEGIDSCLDKKKELPLFVSDGNNQYTVALFNLYSETVTPDRTGMRGRPEVPYKIPRMDLRYAQVIKEREGGKLVKVHKEIIFGDKEDISQSDITTSHIERQNLTFRQENERLARKTIGFSKEDYWLERQMIFYMAFFDFVRPHSGLKLKIEPENDDITNRKYMQRTPMMATGKTNHIWSLEEMLTFPYYKTSVS